MQALNQHTVIVGSGFSGLAMAIRLKKSGCSDFTVLEQADDVGGTWRDNTYPGAACDVPSAVYSFSFEPNPGWSHKFSPQKEIQTYLRHCADKYDIRRHIRFGSQVESSTFDEATGLWTVDIAGQKPLVCRFFIIGAGGLSRPSYPRIPGLESFQGALFHSARWKHDYSLADKRIGVIGTGASSIQIVPAIAGEVAKLSLFQRTPAWILPKADKAYSRLERSLFHKLPGYLTLIRWLLYWQFELRAIGLLKASIMRFGERMARDFIEHEIPDPDLRRKLTPQYTMGCKRILISNDFYQAVNLSHVEVVTDGIERITARGIITKDGREHELDALICATGFQVAEASAPFRIVGRNEKNLADDWKSGAQAYLGTSIAGFPNLFTIVGPNTGLGHNSIVFMIESQVQYIFDGIQKIKKSQLKWVDVKVEVQERYNASLQQKFKETVWSAERCESWYRTESGRNTTLFPGFTFQFRRLTQAFKMNAYEPRHFDNS